MTDREHADAIKNALAHLEETMANALLSGLIMEPELTMRNPLQSNPTLPFKISIKTMRVL